MALQRKNPASIQVSGSVIDFSFVLLLLVNLQHLRNNKIMTTLEKYKKTLCFISPVSPCWFNKRNYHSIACSIESILEGICVISAHLLYI